MKIEFICRNCGIKNEMDTAGARTELRNTNDAPIVYLLKCKCGTENSVAVKGR